MSKIKVVGEGLKDFWVDVEIMFRPGDMLVVNGMVFVVQDVVHSVHIERNMDAHVRSVHITVKPHEGVVL